MLIQIKHGDIRVNVYIETRGFNIFNNLSREDLEFVKCKVTECVISLLDKYSCMYGERRQSDVMV